MSEKTVIGLTGPFGSGCSYIAKKILKCSGYEYISLSDILRDNIENQNVARSDLQNLGNALRSNHGFDYLAKKAVEKIEASECNKFVVDSIRNTNEIKTFKNNYPNFFLLAVWANKDIRWQRVSHKYDGNISLFEQDDKRDKDEKIENGQQITLCYQMSDIIILNQNDILSDDSDNFKYLKTIVKKYVDLIEKNISYIPTEMETLMAMAYANSMRSSCSQRKVGALIIDEYGDIFSSGYNEVPNSERPCRNVYGKCYRKYLRDNMNQQINAALNDDVKLSEKITNIIKSNSKMLDYCRALHAEENAIVNMARLSVSANLSKATLYTTTYPCNLCANKIAQVGIKKSYILSLILKKKRKKFLMSIMLSKYRLKE